MGERESDLEPGITEREKEIALYAFRPNSLPYYELFTAAFWRTSSCGAL